MPRQSKDPEERRQELMDMADQLFLRNGFESVMVSDIVKALGIAQGTFYYYFKSKDEILSAILERKWDWFVAQLETVLSQDGQGALAKLQLVLGMLFQPQSEEQGGFQYFRDSSEAALRFHGQFDQIRTVKLQPLIQQIVREGIAQGEFNSLQYPDEISEILFQGISAFMHHHSPQFHDLDYFNAKMGALEEMMTKILGTKAGALVFALDSKGETER